MVLHQHRGVPRQRIAGLPPLLVSDLQGIAAAGAPSAVHTDFVVAFDFNIMASASNEQSRGFRRGIRAPTARLVSLRDLARFRHITIAKGVRRLYIAFGRSVGGSRGMHMYIPTSGARRRPTGAVRVGRPVVLLP